MAGGAEFLLTQGLTRMLANLARQAGEAISREVADMARAFETATSNGGRFQEVYADVCLAAQQSVLHSYDQLVTAREGPASRTNFRTVSNSPKNKRFAGGVLRRVLASPEFFEVTPEGFSFINTSLLQKEAKHWHRLAFGVAPTGMGGAVSVPVTGDDLALGALGYEEPASPPMVLPPGFWMDPSTLARVAPGGSPGSDLFYPVGELTGTFVGHTVRGRPNKARMTRGFKGRPFFDAGLRTIATMLPRALDQYYEELIAEGESSMPRSVTVVADA